ncbi:MAG TPA: hypothetical protein VIY48_04925, partial [Candidatus Paceibacterota bacterium]
GGVPGIVVGLKEGLMAATYSNYSQAMRRFADITMRPLWRIACASLAPLVDVPPGTRLWYDISDVAALNQGEKDRADTNYVNAQAIKQLVDAGYTPDSVVTAIASGDMNHLVIDTKVEPKQLQPDAGFNGTNNAQQIQMNGNKQIPALAGGKNATN